MFVASNCMVQLRHHHELPNVQMEDPIHQSLCQEEVLVGFWRRSELFPPTAYFGPQSRDPMGGQNLNQVK